MRTWTWPFLAVIGIGLVSSLHSVPFTSDSYPRHRTDIPFERGLTIISGIVEAIDQRTSSLAIRTDQGESVSIQLTQKGQLERFQQGDRVDVEIVLEEGYGMEYVVPAKSQPAKITI
jgi:hypothetical protein